MVKVLQKQLAMAMKEMIEDTGSPLVKKMETLRQILNFSKSMCENGNKDKVIEILNKFSFLIANEYLPQFEDPEFALSKEEAIFRMDIEDLYGEISYIINEAKLIPAYMMGEERLKSPSLEKEEEEEEVF